nr:MAG TPA: hypothetical protein [Caudoviricetes sp.]
MGCSFFLISVNFEVFWSDNRRNQFDVRSLFLYY